MRNGNTIRIAAAAAALLLTLACGKADDTQPATAPKTLNAAATAAATAKPAPTPAPATPARSAPPPTNAPLTSPTLTATPAAAGAATNTAANAVALEASIAPDRLKHMTAVRDELKKRMGPTYTAPIPQLGAAAVKAGGELFVQNCAVCHGDEGRGDGPQSPMFNPHPADLTNMAEATFYSDAAFIEIIKGGVAGSAMPAWEGKMTPEEVLQVFNFVRSVRGR